MTNRWWMQIDLEDPEPAARQLARWSRATRDFFDAELVIRTGRATEVEVASRVGQLVAPFADLFGGAAPVMVEFGELPHDIPDERLLLPRAGSGGGEARERTAALHLEDLRRTLAETVVVTPLRQSAAWAEEFQCLPGCQHLVSDNGSSDGGGTLVAGAGADVVRQPEVLSRTDSWRAALRAVGERTSSPWVKWQFAGDELVLDTATLIHQAAEAFPDAALLVFDYAVRDLDGAVTYRQLAGESRLLEPAESLQRVVAEGNWFGSPTGHAFRREVLDEIELGLLPWVADWSACQSIAAKYPVAYIAAPIGLFDMEQRKHYRSRVASSAALTQECAMRYAALDRLGSSAPRSER